MSDLALPDDLGGRFTRLAEIIGALRERCPWTRALTHESLLEYLVEETYELIEVVEGGTAGPERAAELRGELGDVLLQVLLHARLQQEAGSFSVADVVDELTAKMIRRNPHVFRPDGTLREEGEESDIAAIEQAWDDAKKAESPARVSAFEGIPAGLPALLLAAKTLSRAQRAGRPMPPQTVGGDVAGTGFTDETELGDVLFSLVRRASEQGLDAEAALRAAVRRYTDKDAES
ncbi:MazG nucleotide pyrophosphohydrolase domain-containing protein [Arthrobacter sp. zg-Y877]|uniref:MazG nucleotide pyrophosphohydrolase domain-containing protein n=1 Tax=Arthrobacter sp. zg-Y877 TaxID=3049074 RepID=UPI0025A33D94|nr:MazG nucleotide pyrophosphohydrolase domain-containing protein [Arthrobacter sp. zg-Y877]MDM7990565.1 MazG nucleotide pyrophosphohydrolase domain-containing protein [Arthrobacter sp. zg-Y877]